MFVIDCTGSMQGEIDAMKEDIIYFADFVMNEGLDINLGLIEFRDRLINEEHALHEFSDGIFTKKILEFQKAISLLKASGGGDEPESSPDALMLALKQKFRDCPNKVIVLITDASPHLPDKEVKSYDQIINKMKDIDLNQLYLVTMLDKGSGCLVHLKLLEGIVAYGGHGLAFNLSQKDKSRKENFKKVLAGLAKSITTKSVTL